MKAELQVLSPLVPIREVIFLRFCKQLADCAWAVVDVSIDGLLSNQNSATAQPAANLKCRGLPSGCVMQDTPNGYCKVITKTYIFSLSNSYPRFTFVWHCK
jgi:homeobox-leucine zipper protein